MSIMQLPLRTLALYPSKASLLRYVKEHLLENQRPTNRLRLFIIGGILVVFIIIMKRRSLYRAMKFSSHSSLVQNAAKLTSRSTKMLRNEVSRKSISTYRYLISLLCNLFSTLKNHHSREWQRNIFSMETLIRTRVEKVLELYEMLREKPPMRINLEEDTYSQVQAMCDLLEALLIQICRQEKTCSESYSLKMSPLRLSTKDCIDKSFKPLESNKYNILKDKENNPCDTYEKLNNAISLTERLARDLEIE